MSAQVRVRVRVRVRVQVRLTLTLIKWTACQAALVRVTVEAERDGHTLRVAGRVRRREALGLGEGEQGGGDHDASEAAAWPLHAPTVVAEEGA